MKNATDINEEPGLTCSICREGYKFAPQKVIKIRIFGRVFVFYSQIFICLFFNRFLAAFGHLYVHETLQRGRFRNWPKKNAWIFDGYTFQRGPFRLPFVGR